MKYKKQWNASIIWHTNYGITFIIKIKCYVNGQYQLYYCMCQVSLICFVFFIKPRDEKTWTKHSLKVFTILNFFPPYNLIYSHVQLCFVI